MPKCNFRIEIILVYIKVSLSCWMTDMCEKTSCSYGQMKIKAENVCKRRMRKKKWFYTGKMRREKKKGESFRSVLTVGDLCYSFS